MNTYIILKSSILMSSVTSNMKQFLDQQSPSFVKHSSLPPSPPRNVDLVWSSFASVIWGMEMSKTNAMSRKNYLIFISFFLFFLICLLLIYLYFYYSLFSVPSYGRIITWLKTENLKIISLFICFFLLPQINKKINVIRCIYGFL